MLLLHPDTASYSNKYHIYSHFQARQQRTTGRYNVSNHRTKCTFDVAFDSTCFAAQQKQGRIRAILLLTTVCLQGTQVGSVIEF